MIYSSLLEIFKETPHIRLATKADNENILNFYHQTEMKSNGNSIKYGRGEDFFLFLEERCEKNLVFTLWSDNKQLEGVAVVSYRIGYVDGKLETIGYLGDLRVSLNRKLIREWRKMYTLFITHSYKIPETYFCKHYQTVIIDSNNSAKSSLVKTQIPKLLYKPLEPYKMINIVGKFSNPFLKNSFKIHTAGPTDREEMLRFLDLNEQERAFGINWKEELPYRLKMWSNFSLDNFRILKNDLNEVIAIGNFWNPIKTKQVISSRIPWGFKLLVPLLNFIPFLKIKKLPIENQAINILYLNQIVFKDGLSQRDKKEVFRILIDNIFGINSHFIAYCDFQSESLLNESFSYIKHTINMTMYTVHGLDEFDQIIGPSTYLSKNKSGPGFEMALV